jgi:hypothetical protein
LSCLVSADARAQLASETGLDADLVGLVTLDVAGTELTIVFVFITALNLQMAVRGPHEEKRFAEKFPRYKEFLNENDVWYFPVRK